MTDTKPLAGSAPPPGGAASTAPFWILAAALFGLSAFFLIRPALADLPYYRPRPPGTSDDYWWLLLAAFVPYAVALGAIRRGMRVPMPVLLGGAAVLYAMLIPAPALQSQDVYQYLLFGKMSAAGINPYEVLARSIQDPWRAYTLWDGLVSTYGPLWVLLCEGVVRVSGQNLTAAFLLLKTLVAGSAVAATYGLSRAAGRGPGLEPSPGFAVVAFAYNPMVLFAAGLGGREDMVMAALFAGAIVAERRGRDLGVTLLLSAAALMKAYAGIVLIPWGIVLWRRHGPGVALRHTLLSAGVAALAYARYWHGVDTLAGITDIAGFASASLVGSIVRLASDNVGNSFVGTSALLTAAQVLGTACLLATLWAIARSPRTTTEPWRAGALLFAVFVLVTPWWLYWNLVVLVALVAIVRDRALQWAVLAFSATSLIVITWPAPTTGSGTADLVLQTILRYAPPLVLGGLALRSRQPDPAPALDPAPSP